MVRPILIVALLLMARTGLATHIVGGEVYYECLGNNQYRITLKVYRDCLVGEAPFDSPASISIFRGNGSLHQNIQAYHMGAVQLPVVLTNPCLQAPPNVCVQEAVYQVTATLPFDPEGYHVAYQRCCRNGTIVNLNNPGFQGATYTMRITPEALQLCNSMPAYDEFPPLALCAGDPLVFDHSATDPDGDLLVYSLCAPFVGGTQVAPMPSPSNPPPYGTVTWLNPYSESYPMASDPAMSIDPVTGVLTGTPTQLGQYVLGVCVEEYRNGMLLSVNKRDFQFNVVSCNSFVAAVIPDPLAFHDPCTGRTVNFGNESINAIYYGWDFGSGQAASAELASQQFPTYTFPDTGTYAVTLIANPGYPCADTAVQWVTVYDPVIAEIPPVGGQCADANSFAFQAAGQFGNGSTFQWTFQDAVPPTSTARDPVGISFNGLGTFQVGLTVTEGICSDATSSTVTTYQRPIPLFSPGPHIGCAPLTVSFQDQSASSMGHEAVWTFTDGGQAEGLTASYEFTEPGTFDVTLTITAEEGCPDTVSLTIPVDVTVHPLPSGILQCYPETLSIFEAHFQLSAITTNSEMCTLLCGDGGEYTQTEGFIYEHTYSDTGNFYPVAIFSNEFGCQSTDTAFLRVEPEFRFWLPNAFTPGEDSMNDTWGPVAMGVKEYEMMVFSRWGQLVFHSTDPDEHWDGSVLRQGNLQAMQGVYAYRVMFRSYSGKPFQYYGSVTLVR